VRNRVYAEFVNVGQVVGIARRVAQFKQNALMVVFNGRSPAAQNRQNPPDKEEMRTSDRAGQQYYEHRISTGMDTVQEFAAPAGKAEGKNQCHKQQLNQQNSFNGNYPWTLPPLVPAGSPCGRVKRERKPHAA
jgi:hypothetical protein